jgi:hypothetical protein
VGVVIALLLLTRGTLLLTLPLLVPFIPRRHWRLTLLTALAVMLVWWVRNAIVLQAFVPFSTGGGAVFYGANNPIVYADKSGAWLNTPFLPGYKRYQALDEVSADRAMTQDALRVILSTPFTTLVEIGVRKLQLLMYGGYETRLLALALFTLLAWARLSRRQRRFMLLLAALWLGLVANTLVFWGDDRFRFPIEMVTNVGFGVAVAGLFARLRIRPTKRMK